MDKSLWELVAYDDTVSRKAREESWLAAIRRFGTVEKFLRLHEHSVTDLVFELMEHSYAGYQITAQLYTRNICALLVQSDNAKMLARMLASMMSAIVDENADPRSEIGEVRTGYRIGRFLAYVGGAKLAQAMHAYDGIPPKWEEGLAFAKFDVEREDDAEFCDIARAAVSDDVRNAFDSGKLWLRERVGGGAYLETWRIGVSEEYRMRPEYAHYSRETDFVLQIVKPEAAERAREAYDFILELLGTFDDDVQVGDIDIAGLVPIIRHYRNTLERETNLTWSGKVGAINARLSRMFRLVLENNLGLFRRLKKVVVQFDCATHPEYGEKFRISTEMKGKHFFDLPEDNSDQEVAKFFTAVGSLIYGWYHPFCGDDHDHDRHGYNMRILVGPLSGGTIEVVIGHFDELGICSAPSAEQMEIFAQMCMDAVGAAILNGADLNVAVKDAFCDVSRRIWRGEEGLAEINSLLRALHSATDFQKYVDRFIARISATETTRDMRAAAVYQAVFQALASTRRLSPAFVRVVASRYRGLRVLKASRSAIGRWRSRKAGDRELLAAETAREKLYPKTPAAKTMTTFFQPLVFQRAATQIGSCRVGPYKLEF